MQIGSTAPLRVHNVRLVDGVGRTAVADAVLDADADGLITYAGPASGSPPAPHDVPTIDGGGGTLLPGFFDCHVHLGMPSDRSVVEAALVTDPVVGVLQTAQRLRRTLECGVTSARDLGALPAGFRDAVANGLVEGPRLQVSVGIISHTGGHADTTMPGGMHLGVLALIGFVVLSGRVPDPVVDIRCLGRPLTLTLLVVVLGTGGVPEHAPAVQPAVGGLAGPGARVRPRRGVGAGPAAGCPVDRDRARGVVAGALATRIGPAATLAAGWRSARWRRSCCTPRCRRSRSGSSARSC